MKKCPEGIKKVCCTAMNLNRKFDRTEVSELNPLNSPVCYSRGLAAEGGHSGHRDPRDRGDPAV